MSPDDFEKQVLTPLRVLEAARAEIEPHRAEMMMLGTPGSSMRVICHELNEAHDAAVRMVWARYFASRLAAASQ